MKRPLSLVLSRRSAVTRAAAALGAALGLMSSTASAAPESVRLPEGATATASFATEGSLGVENLFDGKPDTHMIGVGNTAPDSDTAVWINVKFPSPIENLAGLRLGGSDPFNNYFPIAAEFWVDTDGNGTFDTLAGKTDRLGPGDQSKGDRLFDGRIQKAHGLHFRVVKQSSQALKRAFRLNEIQFLSDASAKAIKPTPERDALKDGGGKKGGSSGAASGEGSGGGGASGPIPAKLVKTDADKSIVPGSDKLPGTVIALPAGTKVGTTIRTDGPNNAAKLFDGDPETWMRGAGGSATSRNQVTSVTLRFPEPAENIGGIETGESDPFHNYYPVELQFWADSDGDGRYDTPLGSTRKLGPATQSIGRHLFDGRLERIHGLEIRCVEQNTAGGNRAWTMNEMRLVRHDGLPVVAATPNSWKVLYYPIRLPEGTTASVTVATEEGKGADKLLDNNPETFMNPQPNTAAPGKPVSVFVRLGEPVSDVAGITLGRSDPFGNYQWLKMEVHADTNGDGKYDTLAGTLTGPHGGQRRFSKVLEKVHGLELRVTEQKRVGVNRAFLLSGIDGLVGRDDPGQSVMRFVVEDFEDLASWRTWSVNTTHPEGERVYGGYVYLVGRLDPAKARHGMGVGVARCLFKEKDGRLWATRSKVNSQEAIIEGIEFWAHANGFPAHVSFELADQSGRKFMTPGVRVEGDEWKSYSIEVSARTIPTLAEARFPLKLLHLNVAGKGEGEMLLDDVTLVGVVDRTRRVTITPAHNGIAHTPTEHTLITYYVRNALDTPITAPLVIRLHPSYDHELKSPALERTINLTVPAHGVAEVPIDLGKVPYGHYHARLSLSAPGVEASHVDPVAVLSLNGGRINKSPMWFGSMHPMGWIAHEENLFVLRNVALPLGLDAYRCGLPDGDRRILLDETPLLLAAGFGGMPPHLRLPNQKNEGRGEPNDYEKYFEWALKQAREEYLPSIDRILSVEFYNEPDLPGFEYLPEIDTYLKMHEVFRRAFREAIPGVKIGTGGNTVQHGKEKKDFNPRMYRELAEHADVHIWHAHGALENFIGRHRMVENWVREGGRAVENQLLANSEAGLPSGSTPIGRLHQADNLVKKIGWAKAQPNSYFYIWFTTTDTFDPQGGYLGGENWGLVTYNQRLKPSGQAYNELIKRLANTQGLGERDLDPRLQTCAFQRDDGAEVFLAWPRERGLRMLMRFAASGPVTVSDMFGASRRVEPTDGVVVLEGNGYPFYVEAAKGVRFGPPPVTDYLSFPGVLGVPPGGRIALPVRVSSSWQSEAALTLTLLDDAGKEVSKAEARVKPGETAGVELSGTIAADAKFGSRSYRLIARGMPGTSTDLTLPLQVVVAQVAARAGPFNMDGKPDAVPANSVIAVEKDTAMFDQVSDPQTPLWAGAADLSAKASLAHDGKGLYVCIEVMDQTHKPGPASDKLWTSDSVQVAFYVGDKHTEIGLTESEGGFGWVWFSPDPARRGKLDAPISVKRLADRTVYETYLSFDMLGLSYQPNTAMRMCFLVNEDDGRGRVRLLKWYDGIAAGKDPTGFGHLVLE